MSRQLQLKYFLQDIQDSIPTTRIYQDALHTVAYSGDASFYRFYPQIVIKVENEAEIIAILKAALKQEVAVTFRAGGTSLSGQSVSDSILIVLGAWSKYFIHDNGTKINLQPGITGAQANAYLASYHRKIGPDPASIAAAKIGGIAANNASGMCCGVKYNSYHTLAGMRIVLIDGTVLDTRDPTSVAAFKKTHSHLIQQIIDLAEQIKADQTLSDKIRQKYIIKNTTGYSLNAFIDFTDPIDIIAHLMIGSEGTLGFISDITYHTIEDYTFKASAFIFFPDPHIACQAVQKLTSCPVNAAELFDGAALQAARIFSHLPDILYTLDLKATAILVETSAKDASLLANSIKQIETALQDIPVLAPITFTSDPHIYNYYWKARKGLYPALGNARAPGTTALIEDIAVSIDQLADCIVDLQQLFRKYHYSDASMMGHSLFGNLHVIFSVSFDNESAIENYRKFMEEFTDIVATKYGGSLKAEHGTGRNIAPFVEKEWGPDAYHFMQTIKNIFDPSHILNPGVIINSDPNAHIQHLKAMPAVDPSIDKCMELGFCERVCPSRNLSYSPRQRIIVAREIKRLETTQENPQTLEELKKGYSYMGVETCAATGLCGDACPISVNTGEYIIRLRTQQHQNHPNSLSPWIGKHFAFVIRAGRMSLNALYAIQSIMGSFLMQGITNFARTITFKKLPKWTPYMPRGATTVNTQNAIENQLKVVYFPSCIARTMGLPKGSPEKSDLHTVMKTLLDKANYQVLYPSNLPNLCCGLAFESKGIQEVDTIKHHEIEKSLLEISNHGKIPIVCETSPCVLHLRKSIDKSLQIYEPVEFIDRFLKDRLLFKRKKNLIALHRTCSSTRMGLDDTFKNVAELCAEKVIIPEGVTCCGFAGDRGFNVPELNDAALATLRKEIPSDCKDGYSNSITCEIGLSDHADIFYRSIAYLVNECAEKKT